MESEGGKIYYGLGLDNKQLQDDARRAVAEIQSIGDKAEAEGNRIDNAFRTAASSIGLSLAGVSVGGFLQKMFQVRSEFQDTESSMRVFLGSAEKAADFMKKLQDYAWYNMFEFSDLTKESAKLLAFGNDVDSVIPILDKLSNIAAGTKVPLSDLVDLYDKAKNVGKIDAMGLQSWATKGVVITDVLKQMGVEVDSSAIKFEHLEMVLNKLTSEGGMFHGLMNEQMQNLSASFGQLQDDISIMFNELGQKAEGTMKGLIDSADWVVKNYEKVGKTILDIAVAYGAYRAAIMAVVAVQKVSASVQYATEIAELSKLLPLKEQSAFADIQAAVASGKLTQAKAEQLIAVKLDVQAKLEELQANQALAVSELTAANTARKAALEKSIAVKASIAAKQTELQQAILSGNAQKVETLQKELSTFSQQKDTIAVEMNNASKARASAQSKVKSTTTAVETMTTNINTAGTVANANANNFLSVAKIKLTAITAKLNAVIMSNPYMLAAAAIAALAFGIYKLVTANNASEIATRNLNDELEKQKNLKDDLISRTKQLSDKLKDNAKTIYEQIEAYQKLKKELPEVYAKMTFQQTKTLTPEQHSKIQSEAADNRSLKAEEERIAKLEDLLRRAKDVSLFNLSDKAVKFDFIKLFDVGYWESIKITNNDIVKSIEQQLNGYKDIKGEREKIIEQENFNKKTNSEKLTILDEQLKKYQDQYAELEKQVPESARIADTINNSLSPSIDNTKKGILNVNDTWSKFDFQTQANIAQLNFLNVKINEVGNTIKSINKGITYAQAKQDAKDDYDKAKKLFDDISKNGKKYSKDDYIKATEDLEKKKKAYQELGGETTVKKGTDDSQKRLDAMKRLTEIEKENSLETERFRIDMAQREIDLMDDSYEKRRKQLKLNLEKEAQTIEEFKQKKVKEQQDIEKEQWTAKGSKGIFNPTTVSFDRLSENVKAQAEELAKAADAVYKKRQKDLNQYLSDMSDEQRLMFADNLTKDLAELDKYYEEQRIKAEGNAKLIEQIEINHARAIKEVKTKDTIEKLDFGEQLEKERLAGMESLGMTELVEREKLEITRKYIRFRIAALKELAKTGDQDSKKQIQMLEASLKNLDKKNPAKGLKELADGALFNKIQKGYEKVIAASGKYTVAEIAAGKAAEEAKSKTIELFNQIIKKASTVAETADLMKSSFGGLDKDLDEVLDAVGNIANGFAKGGIVGGIMAIIGEGMKLFSKAAEAEKRHQEALKVIAEGRIALQRQYNLLLLEQNLLLKKATTIFGSNEIEKAANAIKVYGEALRALQDSIKGEKPGNPDLFQRITREYEKHLNAYNKGIGGLYNAKIVTGHDKTGLFGWGKGADVYSSILSVYDDVIDKEGNINKQRIQTILDTQKMNDETRAYLQNLIALQEQAEKAQEALRDYLNQTFGSLGSELMKSITDSIRNEGVEAWKEFGKAGASVLEKLGEQLAYELFFSQKFKDLQKELEAVYGSGNDSKDIAYEAMNIIGGFYEKIGTEMDAAQTFLDEWKRKAGNKGFDLWSNEDAQGNDNSLKGAYSKASQESIDLLAGQTGAARVALEAIREYQTIAVAQVKQIADQMNYMKDIHIQGWGEVRMIKELSMRVADNSDRIRDLSASISDNTKKTSAVLDSANGGNYLRVKVQGV